MLCLGIETSCDETALAFVRDGRLLGECMASQATVHSVFGGVVPEIASRRHLSAISPLFGELLASTGIDLAEIDRVCVARGPGLLGSLLVGLGFAKGLALGLDIPLIGVNHLHAHLLAPGLESRLDFPCLGLLISGGHTQIYRMRSPREFELLGRTLDDAAGEAFDKAAKCLNLPYPGGVYIDRLASLAEAIDPDLFPVPYVDNDNLDFSFSGLKTSVGNYVRKRPGLVAGNLRSELPRDPDPELVRVCAAFNRSVARALHIKLARALDRYGVNSVIAAGGVAANSMVRAELKSLAADCGVRFVLPHPELCTDNGAMIAYAGYLLAGKGLSHGLDLEAVPRGRAVPDDYSAAVLEGI
ncbi:MAG: tRNA (adenosine(37)-N6)-threonylcarbamoyltransferase complex transferase subunit TsaD [Desulfonatronovibrionaceae bacterium]